MGLWLFLFNFFVSDYYQHANFLGTLFNNKVLGVSVPQGNGLWVDDTTFSTTLANVQI